METVRLAIDIEFDETVTNADEVQRAMSNLLSTALSTPGVLEDLGPLTFEPFDDITRNTR